MKSFNTTQTMTVGVNTEEGKLPGLGRFVWFNFEDEKTGLKFTHILSHKEFDDIVALYKAG